MNFTDILSEYNIPQAPEGHHHCRSGWLQIDCPFCGKDTHKWHMGYNLSDKYCICWRCGWHPLIQVVAEITDTSFSTAKKLIGDLSSVKHIEEKHAGKLIIPKGVCKLQSPHRNYLTRRGFNPKRLEKYWEIKGIGIASELQWRIFIPIHYKGKVVSWTTRSISDKTKAKYINATAEQESILHSKLLYGEEYASHTILIFEGPTDVWAIGPGAVATLGINYSKSQVAKMIEHPLRYVCFDNEPQAQQRAKQLCDELSLFPGKTYNITLDANDPASAKPKEINKLKKLLK